MLATYAKRAFATTTVNVAVPVSAPSVAVIVDVPTATPSATPVVALIVAVAGVPELNVTEFGGGLCNELSLHFSCTVNATELLTAMFGVAGVSTKDTGPGAPTVSVVFPLALPKVALITLVPAPTPVAKPVELIVATPIVADAHVVAGSLDTSSVPIVPSGFVIVAVATNCSVAPPAIIGLTGVTATETTLVTVREAVPDIPVIVAVIVVVPGATAVARPVADIVATAGLEEDHVAVLVISVGEPLLNVAVAVYCKVSSTAAWVRCAAEGADLVIVAVDGVTDMDRNFGVPLLHAVSNANTNNPTAPSVKPLDFIRISPPQRTIPNFF
jgi:hypothetical protein